jgi:hypothetical protein
VCEKCAWKLRAAQKRVEQAKAAGLAVTTERLTGEGKCVECGAVFHYQVRYYLEGKLEAPTKCRYHRKLEAERQRRREDRDQRRQSRLPATERRLKYASAACTQCGRKFRYYEKVGKDEAAPTACQDCRHRDQMREYSRSRRAGQWEPKRGGKPEGTGGIPIGLYGVIHNPLDKWDCRVIDYPDLRRLVEEDELPIGMELMSRKGVGVAVTVDGLRLLGKNEAVKRLEAWNGFDDTTGEDGEECEANDGLALHGGSRAGAGGDQRLGTEPAFAVQARD